MTNPHRGLIGDPQWTSDNHASVECVGCGDPIDWYPSEGPVPTLCASCLADAPQEIRNEHHRRELQRSKR